MTILDLCADDADRVQAAAALLVECFRVHAPTAWPDMDAGLEEVRESLAPDRISRVAVDARGEVLGWIGAQPQYDGHVWELAMNPFWPLDADGTLTLPEAR